MIKANAYQNSYYTIILVPIGLCIYLFIKFSSDFHVENKGFVINSFDNDFDRELISKDFLINAVHKAQKLNDINFMFSGLPVMLCDIGSIKNISRTKCEEHIVIHDYLNSLLYFYNMGFTNNCIILEKDRSDNFNIFISRLLYNEFIEHGDILIKNDNNIEKLINRNKVISSRNIVIKDISITRKLSTTKIVTLNLFQHRIFENRKCLPKKGNAIMFFCCLDKLIKVIDC